MEDDEAKAQHRAKMRTMMREKYRSDVEHACKIRLNYYHKLYKDDTKYHELQQNLNQDTYKSRLTAAKLYHFQQKIDNL